MTRIKEYLTFLVTVPALPPGLILCVILIPIFYHLWHIILAAVLSAYVASGAAVFVMVTVASGRNRIAHSFVWLEKRKKAHLAEARSIGEFTARFNQLAGPMLPKGVHILIRIVGSATLALIFLIAPILIMIFSPLGSNLRNGGDASRIEVGALFGTLILVVYMLFTTNDVKFRIMRMMSLVLMVMVVSLSIAIYSQFNGFPEEYRDWGHIGGVLLVNVLIVVYDSMVCRGLDGPGARGGEHRIEAEMCLTADVLTTLALWGAVAYWFMRKDEGGEQIDAILAGAFVMQFVMSALLTVTVKVSLGAALRKDLEDNAAIAVTAGH